MSNHRRPSGVSARWGAEGGSPYWKDQKYAGGDPGGVTGEEEYELYAQ